MAVCTHKCHSTCEQPGTYAHTLAGLAYTVGDTCQPAHKTPSKRPHGQQQHQQPSTHALIISMRVQRHLATQVPGTDATMQMAHFYSISQQQATTGLSVVEQDHVLCIMDAAFHLQPGHHKNSFRDRQQCTRGPPKPSTAVPDSQLLCRCRADLALQP
jgi:hypothetical protein